MMITVGFAWIYLFQENQVGGKKQSLARDSCHKSLFVISSLTERKDKLLVSWEG